MKEFAESLAKDANDLVARIRENRTSFATLVADAGTLAYRYNNLRVDTIRAHEENQRNEI